MALTTDQTVQIERVLEDKFFLYVPQRTDSPTRGWTDMQHRTDRLSRSLGAFAIQHLTAFSEADAAGTIVDGFGDNGIDAICFDRITNQLILVQAKFSPGRTPDLADTMKFIEGVRDVLSKQFGNFNEGFRLRQPEILDAYDQPKLKIKIALAHLGSGFSTLVTQRLEQLVTEVNRHAERATLEALDGEKVYATLTAQHDAPAIDDVLELHHWIISETTPRILHGQVSAGQLATLFEQHGRHLFIKNIRDYTGSSDVNDAIARTVQEEPELLLHLNNGLTMVCGRFEPFPATSQSFGRISLEGLSVVNGAQTVGTIAQISRDVDLSNSPAKVQLTVIESSGITEFENRVTQARNTQNRVRPADFAAQDANQNRLRRELAVSGIEYHYKATENRGISESSNVFIEEAAPALACFSSNIEDVVTLRKSPSQLSDPSTSVYNRLFSGSLTGTNLYRKVTIFRLLNGIADEAERASPTNSSEKTFYRHMRFFVMHFIKRRNAAVFSAPGITLSEEDQAVLSRAFNELSVLIYQIGQGYLGEAQSGYLAVSRKLTDCSQLARRVQAAIEAETLQKSSL